MTSGTGLGREGIRADTTKRRPDTGRTALRGEQYVRGSCLGFNDFAGLNAAGADANALVGPGRELCLDRAKIDIPATAGDVMRVRNVVAELRAFAADVAYLCHNLLQTS